MRANGKSPSALAREIETAYRSYVNNPVVTVSIEGFEGSRNQNISIVGASADAKTLPYVEGMTLLDLIISVGGLSEFSNGNKAVLIREQKSESLKYSLRINDLIRKGDISANVKMVPGDIVLIPQSNF